MIDYNELENYYIGSIVRVSESIGGLLLNFDDEINTLLYKIDDDYYIDVNSGLIAQVIKRGTPFKSDYSVIENTLIKANNKMDIIKNSKLSKRLTFNSNKYKKNN